MKVLVACEFSGIVREAFADLGHESYSCDLIPGQIELGTVPAGKHIVGDVRKILNDGWDLMVGHPPCTYLSYAGNRWMNDVSRKEKQAEAIEFFKVLWQAPIQKICLENPLGVVSKELPHQQIIHPYMFGEPYRKRTCLWLKNLPLLVPTVVVKAEDKYFNTGRKKVCTDIITKGSGESRQRARSKFHKGIAYAMAQQWGR